MSWNWSNCCRKPDNEAGREGGGERGGGGKLENLEDGQSKQVPSCIKTERTKDIWNENKTKDESMRL